MRKTIPWIAAVAALFLSLPALAGEPSPYLTDAERQELIDLLNRSKAEFDQLVAGVEGEAWTFKPAPDKWSVGEVAEHLLLAEGLLFGIVEGALEADPNPEWQAAEAKGIEILLQRVPDRSQKFQAPEPIQPKGEMGRAELLDKFAAARQGTLDFVRTTQAPVKQHTAPNPLTGDANVRQWVVFIAAHNLRHNQQIAEVKEAMAAQPTSP